MLPGVMASQDSSHKERLHSAMDDIETAAISISLIEAKRLTLQERVDLCKLYKRLEDVIETRIDCPDDCGECAWDCILHSYGVH